MYRSSLTQKSRELGYTQQDTGYRLHANRDAETNSVFAEKDIKKEAEAFSFSKASKADIAAAIERAVSIKGVIGLQPDRYGKHHHF